jgi:hypothetical protein
VPAARPSAPTFKTKDDWAIRGYNEESCLKQDGRMQGQNSLECFTISGKGAKSFHMVGYDPCWIEAWEVSACGKGRSKTFKQPWWRSRYEGKPSARWKKRIWRETEIGASVRLKSFRVTCK